MKKLAMLFLAALLLLVLSVSIASMIAFQKEPWTERIAVIPIYGTITSGSTVGVGGADSIHIIESIESAEKNPSVKAIVLEINSPGGSPVASAEIAEAIKKAEKPTVAWIGEIGASGGYWAASAADQVIAHPMSLTGSIGAFSTVFELEGLMEKIGVTQQTIKSGEFKDIGTPFRNMTEEEREIFQEIVIDMKDQFVEAVAENRGIPREQVMQIADGRPYLAKKALELDLVDQLGSRKDAIVLAAELSNTTTRKTIYYGKERNPLEGMLSEASASLGYGISRGFSSGIFN